MAAYYNEHDAYAAQWLRNLIAAGHIAPGDVDERDIRDVHPDDLRGYRQCHFFAGIGVWSYALRLAGWEDHEPVWTGSCPCQPFSAAGRGAGFADERHLWPHFHHLIRECRPPVVLGEQVASKDGLGWLDLVRADLQGEGYAVGAADLCAAGVGAPHIRQRLWWVAERLAYDDAHGRGGEPAARLHGRRTRAGRAEASEGDTDRSLGDHAFRRGAHGRLDDDDDEGLEGLRGGHPPADGRVGTVRSAASAGEPRGVADSGGGGGRERWPHPGRPIGESEAKRRQDPSDAERGGDFVGLADEPSGRRGEERPHVGREPAGDRAQRLAAGSASSSSDRGPRPTDGFWRTADWLWCRDGKWRPVEPGTFPLAHGTPARVGRLRAYGNAIVPQVAAAFVAAFRDARRVRVMPSDGVFG